MATLDGRPQEGSLPSWSCQRKQPKGFVRLPERGHRYRPKPRAWYSAPWVAVLAVVLVIPVWATETPSYCMSCKATKPAGVAWQTSTHAKVSCTESHVPPGVVNAIKWRSREWRNIWAD